VDTLSNRRKDAASFKKILKAYTADHKEAKSLRVFEVTKPADLDGRAGIFLIDAKTLQQIYHTSPLSLKGFHMLTVDEVEAVFMTVRLTYGRILDAYSKLDPGQKVVNDAFYKLAQVLRIKIAGKHFSECLNKTIFSDGSVFERDATGEVILKQQTASAWIDKVIRDNPDLVRALGNEGNARLLLINFVNRGTDIIVKGRSGANGGLRKVKSITGRYRGYVMVDGLGNKQPNMRYGDPIKSFAAAMRFGATAREAFNEMYSSASDSVSIFGAINYVNNNSAFGRNILLGFGGTIDGMMGVLRAMNANVVSLGVSTWDDTMSRQLLFRNADEAFKALVDQYVASFLGLRKGNRSGRISARAIPHIGVTDVDMAKSLAKAIQAELAKRGHSGVKVNYYTDPSKYQSAFDNVVARDIRAGNTVMQTAFGQQIHIIAKYFTGANCAAMRNGKIITSNDHGSIFTHVMFATLGNAPNASYAIQRNARTNIAIAGEGYVRAPTIWVKSHGEVVTGKNAIMNFIDVMDLQITNSELKDFIKCELNSDEAQNLVRTYMERANNVVDNRQTAEYLESKQVQSITVEDIIVKMQDLRVDINHLVGQIRSGQVDSVEEACGTLRDKFAQLNILSFISAMPVNELGADSLTSLLGDPEALRNSLVNMLGTRAAGIDLAGLSGLLGPSADYVDSARAVIWGEDGQGIDIGGLAINAEAVRVADDGTLRALGTCTIYDEHDGTRNANIEIIGRNDMTTTGLGLAVSGNNITITVSSQAFMLDAQVSQAAILAEFAAALKHVNVRIGNMALEGKTKPPDLIEAANALLVTCDKFAYMGRRSSTLRDTTKSIVTELSEVIHSSLSRSLSVDERPDVISGLAVTVSHLQDLMAGGVMVNDALNSIVGSITRLLTIDAETPLNVDTLPDLLTALDQAVTAVTGIRGKTNEVKIPFEVFKQGVNEVVSTALDVITRAQGELRGRTNVSREVVRGVSRSIGAINSHADMLESAHVDKLVQVTMGIYRMLPMIDVSGDPLEVIDSVGLAIEAASDVAANTSVTDENRSAIVSASITALTDLQDNLRGEGISVELRKGLLRIARETVYSVFEAVGSTDISTAAPAQITEGLNVLRTAGTYVVNYGTALRRLNTAISYVDQSSVEYRALSRLAVRLVEDSTPQGAVDQALNLSYVIFRDYAINEINEAGLRDNLKEAVTILTQVANQAGRQTPLVDMGSSKDRLERLVRKVGRDNPIAAALRNSIGAYMEQDLTPEIAVSILHEVNMAGARDVIYNNNHSVVSEAITGALDTVRQLAGRSRRPYDAVNPDTIRTALIEARNLLLDIGQDDLALAFTHSIKTFDDTPTPSKAALIHQLLSAAVVNVIGTVSSWKYEAVATALDMLREYGKVYLEEDRHVLDEVVNTAAGQEPVAQQALASSLTVNSLTAAIDTLNTGYLETDGAVDLVRAFTDARTAVAENEPGSLRARRAYVDAASAYYRMPADVVQTAAEIKTALSALREFALTDSVSVFRGAETDAGALSSQLILTSGILNAGVDEASDHDAAVTVVNAFRAAGRNIAENSVASGTDEAKGVFTSVAVAVRNVDARFMTAASFAVLDSLRIFAYGADVSAVTGVFRTAAIVSVRLFGASTSIGNMGMPLAEPLMRALGRAGHDIDRLARSGQDRNALEIAARAAYSDIMNAVFDISDRNVRDRVFASAELTGIMNTLYDIAMPAEAGMMGRMATDSALLADALRRSAGRMADDASVSSLQVVLLRAANIMDAGILPDSVVAGSAFRMITDELSNLSADDRRDHVNVGTMAVIERLRQFAAGYAPATGYHAPVHGLNRLDLAVARMDVPDTAPAIVSGIVEGLRNGLGRLNDLRNRGQAWKIDAYVNAVQATEMDVLNTMISRIDGVDESARGILQRATGLLIGIYVGAVGHIRSRFRTGTADMSRLRDMISKFTRTVSVLEQTSNPLIQILQAAGGKMQALIESDEALIAERVMGFVRTAQDKVMYQVINDISAQDSAGVTGDMRERLMSSVRALREVETDISLAGLLAEFGESEYTVGVTSRNYNYAMVLLLSADSLEAAYTDDRFEKVSNALRDVGVRLVQDNDIDVDLLGSAAGEIDAALKKARVDSFESINQESVCVACTRALDVLRDAGTVRAGTSDAATSEIGVVTELDRVREDMADLSVRVMRSGNASLASDVAALHSLVSEIRSSITGQEIDADKSGINSALSQVANTLENMPLDMGDIDAVNNGLRSLRNHVCHVGSLLLNSLYSNLALRGDIVPGSGSLGRLFTSVDRITSDAETILNSEAVHSMAIVIGVMSDALLQKKGSGVLDISGIKQSLNTFIAEGLRERAGKLADDMAVAEKGMVIIIDNAIPESNAMKAMRRIIESDGGAVVSVNMNADPSHILDQIQAARAKVERSTGKADIGYYAMINENNLSKVKVLTALAKLGDIIACIVNSSTSWAQVLSEIVSYARMKGEEYINARQEAKLLEEIHLGDGITLPAVEVESTAIRDNEQFFKTLEDELAAELAY